MHEPIAEVSRAFRAFEGLVVRFPRVVMDWDFVSMKVAPTEKTKHCEVSQQEKCLCYTTIYGDPQLAGLSKGIEMELGRALADWLGRGNRRWPADKL